MKNCPFSGEPCTTDACMLWGIAPGLEDKMCLLFAACVSSIVCGNKVLRDNRSPGIPFDSMTDDGDDDDDELPSSRPRRFV